MNDFPCHECCKEHQSEITFIASKRQALLPLLTAALSFVCAAHLLTMRRKRQQYAILLEARSAKLPNRTATNANTFD